MLADSSIAAIETVLWGIAERRFPEQVCQQRELVAAVRELSRAYAENRAPRGGDFLLARLLFFTVADLPKIAFPLLELRRRGQLPTGPLRLLDVGAGCGTLTLGALATLGDAVEQICLVDRDAAVLNLAKTAVTEFGTQIGSTPRLRLAERDLRRVVALERIDGPFELIVAGNLLTELPAGKRRKLVDQLLSRLSDDGFLIIIEPALRKSTKELHTLRDALLEDAAAHVFAPCTHQRPCPMLGDEAAWCHEIRIWQLPPPRLRKLASASGLRRRDIKFSYLTLSRHAAGDVSGAAEAAEGLAEKLALTAADPAYRVVGSVQRSKGKRELALCGPEGRRCALRLDRHRSATNRPIEKLGRGRLVWFRGLEPEKSADSCRGLLRIGKQTEVLPLDPAAP